MTEKQIVERNRNETIGKLRQLKGVSLWALASHYGVLYLDGEKRVNMHCVTNTLEEYIELPHGSLYNTQFYDEDGPWYLNLISLTYVADKWVMSNNLTISRMEEDDPPPEFQKSHLYSWITRYVALGIGYFESRGKPEPRYEVVRVTSFDATAPENREFLEEIEADYELVRAVLNLENGYSMLTGYIGRWLDPPLTRRHDFGFMDYWFHEIYA